MRDLFVYAPFDIPWRHDRRPTYRADWWVQEREFSPALQEVLRQLGEDLVWKLYQLQPADSAYILKSLRRLT